MKQLKCYIGSTICSRLNYEKKNYLYMKNRPIVVTFSLFRHFKFGRSQHKSDEKKYQKENKLNFVYVLNSILLQLKHTELYR